VSRPIRAYQIVATDHVAKPAAPPWHQRQTVLIAIAGVVILAGLAVILLRSRSLPPAITQAESAAKHTISSIAVLPLDNYSGNPNQEYFADGMTDMLTTDLAKISALRVISRSSVMQYKGDHRRPPPEIAKTLNVDAVLEGSVLRIGDKVRITVQLIDAAADEHLWAESYERNSSDVLAMQDELASAIARQINIEVTPDEQARALPTPAASTPGPS
jgi:TolB-like protein